MRWSVADERGNVTILAAFAIAAIVSVLVLVIYLGAAVLARHRAQSAADLAALAAAVEHGVGARDPCRRAHELAAAQTPPAEIDRCLLDGRDVVVSTRVRVDLGGFGVHAATAHARAGPA